MAWSLLAHAVASDVTAPVTSAIDTTGADLLVAVISSIKVTDVTAAVSDSKSNSWTLGTAQLKNSAGSVMAPVMEGDRVQ